MNLTPKIKYQLFLYNYFLKYIRDNLYNYYYSVNKKDMYIQEIKCLKNEINELNEIHKNEHIKFKKSRGKHRIHLKFLKNIRDAVLNNKKNILSQNIKFIEHIEENENGNKFYYKNYDDYFSIHVNRYKFIQKIKCELKNIYDTRIENIYKDIYHPKKITQMLENNIEIDNVFIFLDKEIQNIMYNIF
jgi:hypothetical protein